MTSRPCARGCTIRGQHAPGVAAEHDHATCTGCVPRPAEFGLLCAWDWQRLTGDVVDTATLVHHLRDQAEPHASAKAPTDGPRAYRDPSEGSVLSDAVEAADELHATLAELADRILDEHPRTALGLNHPGRLVRPDERGVWRSQQTTRTDPDTGDRYVIRSVVVGIRDATATDRLVAWLLPLLPWVAEQAWVVDTRDDLARIVSTTRARWPLEDRTRTLHVPCPDCEHLGIRHTPPAAHGHPARAECKNPECARTFTEAECDDLRELAAHR